MPHLMTTTLDNIRHRITITIQRPHHAGFAFLAASWVFVFLIFWFPSTTTHINILIQKQQQKHMQHNLHNVTSKPLFIVPTCSPSLSVYMYTLPAQFNLAERCRNLTPTHSLCPRLTNSGLGEPLHLDKAAGGSTTSWFNTNQFAAEIIFRARMENYPCRTWNPARATLFYVPFYGGLYAWSKFHERNITARNALAVGLNDYIQAQPWWRRNNGKDHFMALGTVVWDFMGVVSNVSRANRLLDLPATKNMSALIIERHPWRSNHHGIPYPSYFHPSTWQEMVAWQNNVMGIERPHLFAFVGSGGPNKQPFRNELIRQCRESTRCMLLNCGGPGVNKCNRPSELLKVMTRSPFCLQAPGDTSTRRSTSDSILAGCIPVFFSRHVAYTQYTWYLPRDASKYSVYIDEKSNASKKIEAELLQISSQKVVMMREKLVGLIPSITYTHPTATNIGFADAVDVALASLAKK